MVRKWKCVCAGGALFKENKIYEEDSARGLTAEDGFAFRKGDSNSAAEWLNNNGFYKFEEVKEDMFTKSDLKTGHIVTCRNGYKYLVMKDTPDGDMMYGVSEQAGHLYFDEFNENLTCKSVRDFDIMTIKEPFARNVNELAEEDIFYDKTVWEREEPKELTVAEISKLLGYTVKVIEG